MLYCANVSVLVPYLVRYLCIGNDSVCGTVPAYAVLCLRMWYCAFVLVTITYAVYSVEVLYVVLYLYLYISRVPMWVDRANLS